MIPVELHGIKITVKTLINFSSNWIEMKYSQKIHPFIQWIELKHWIEVKYFHLKDFATVLENQY